VQKAWRFCRRQQLQMIEMLIEEGVGYISSNFLEAASLFYVLFNFNLSFTILIRPLIRDEVFQNLEPLGNRSPQVFSLNNYCHSLSEWKLMAIVTFILKVSLCKPHQVTHWYVFVNDLLQKAKCSKPLLQKRRSTQ